MTRPLAIAFLACHRRPGRQAGDASWLYRADNLAQALAGLGHEVWCGHFTRTPARRFDLVVLHRPSLDWRLRLQLRRWRRLGSRVLADVDDLVFEPALAAHSPAVLNRVLPVAEVARRFAAQRAALAEADALSVSTAPLAEELALQGARQPVLVLPNAVHHRWRGLPATPMNQDAPRLAYLSGTHSHDLDLAEAAPALRALLAGRPGLCLEITGRGRFELGLPPAQWLQRPRQPFAGAYADAIRRARVSLMPLQATRFNRCKSALKLIEAGFWNVPTVASPVPDAQRFAGTGVRWAADGDGWQPAIEALLDDPQAGIAVFAGQWLAWVRGLGLR